MSSLERILQIELRKLRDALALELGVEPYKILHNETIDLIAEERPETTLELLSIKGIGPSKSKRFGKRILEIVKTAGIDPESERVQSEPKVYSVGEFLDHFNISFARKPVSIRGEVSDVKRPRPELIYFSLKDPEDNAVLSCFMRTRIERNMGAELSEGTEVVVSGFLGAYKPSGRFSLNVTEFLLEGEGALQRAFEELKKRLEKDGLFWEEGKKTPPPFIRRIGLITAAGSDAERDFCTHVGKFGFSIERYDVRVEGLQAVSQICRAINYFNERGDMVDVLVITRGGGSLESLQAFNSEQVARAIFSSKICTISGVGHERDVTIADLVADVRASTPTHAGKLVSADWTDARPRMTRLFDELVSYSKNSIREVEHISLRRMQLLERSLEKLSQEYLVQISRLLTALSTNALHAFEFVKDSERDLEFYRTKIDQKIIQNKRFFEVERRNIEDHIRYFYQSIVSRLNSHARELLASNPELKLKQGYALAFDKKGRVVTSVDMLVQGDILKTKLKDGEVDSEVRRIRK